MQFIEKIEKYALKDRLKEVIFLHLIEILPITCNQYKYFNIFENKTVTIVVKNCQMDIVLYFDSLETYAMRLFNSLFLILYSNLNIPRALLDRYILKK